MMGHLTDKIMSTIMATSDGGVSMVDGKYTSRVIYIVDGLLDQCGSNYSRASQGMNLSRQALWKMVHSGEIKFSTFLEMLRVLNVDISFQGKKKIYKWKNMDTGLLRLCTVLEFLDLYGLSLILTPVRVVGGEAAAAGLSGD